MSTVYIKLSLSLTLMCPGGWESLAEGTKCSNRIICHPLKWLNLIVAVPRFILIIYSLNWFFYSLIVHVFLYRSHICKCVWFPYEWWNYIIIKIFFFNITWIIPRIMTVLHILLQLTILNLHMEHTSTFNMS